MSASGHKWECGERSDHVSKTQKPDKMLLCRESTLCQTSCLEALAAADPGNTGWQCDFCGPSRALNRTKVHERLQALRLRHAAE
jgi:hypothetical protein